ncbi:MAG: putative mannitol operon repressor [Phycisphaerales bacterium]|nr:putative mannitol operon repressor [Phycisphaerales bacterium]
MVGAAYVDDLLAGMLRSYLVDDAKLVDALLESQGPLGTFSSRINLVYALGLIRDDQLADLNTLRKIRNEFAHSHKALSFDVQPICDLCDNLNQIRLMSLLRGQMSAEERDILLDRVKTRRQRFVGNCVHLAVGLMVRGAAIKHREPGRELDSSGSTLPFEGNQPA